MTLRVPWTASIRFFTLSMVARLDFWDDVFQSNLIGYALIGKDPDLLGCNLQSQSFAIGCVLFTSFIF